MRRMRSALTKTVENARVVPCLEGNRTGVFLMNGMDAVSYTHLLAAVFFGGVDDLLDALDVGRKRRNDDAASLCTQEQAVKALAHLAFRSRIARALCIGRVVCFLFFDSCFFFYFIVRPCLFNRSDREERCV